MVTAKTNSSSPIEIRVSDYDRLSALLIASLIALGAFLLILSALLFSEPSVSWLSRPDPLDGGRAETADLDSQATNQIWRISNVERTNSVTLIGRRHEDQANYFVPTDSRLASWDDVFVGQSGVTLPKTILVHFFPDSTVKRMKQIEFSSLPAGKKITDVKQTSFKLNPTNVGFEFEIVDFSYI